MLPWVSIGLALTAVGLSLRLMFMKASLTKKALLLKAAKAENASLLKSLEESQTRSNERITQLKRKANALLEESIKNSKPGDLRNSLNKLLSND